ncbi:nuclear transport factor 2 family protein [Nocardia flavorosea]|uniref:nuclear transport factor 2 family protein n=1 Tax=Nocardia flavorosea TaxID=53429 RepID=UPI001893991B|nr:nuclear transport factor 2 family protein [Nocardia flavorosea]MBF6350971.1 nuclear transport factor 2 family protein [Nocardia flavorosea]
MEVKTTVYELSQYTGIRRAAMVSGVSLRTMCSVAEQRERAEMDSELDEKATRFLRNLEILDFDSMRAMCTDTAVVWHNDGTGDQPIAEKLSRLESLSGQVLSLEYEIVRQFCRPPEVLQQNILRLRLEGGTASEIHSATYFRFDGSLIDRMEEYTYTVPSTGRRSGADSGPGESRP